MNTELIAVSNKRKPADLLVVGVFEEQIPTSLKALEPDFLTLLKKAKMVKRFSGKFGQSFYAYDHFKEAPEVLVLGLGPKRQFQKKCLRKITCSLVQQVKTRKIQRARVDLDSFIGGKISAAETAGIIAEYAILASYRFNKYKTNQGKSKKAEKLAKLELLVQKSHREVNVKKTVAASQAIAEGVLRARTFINEPGNVLTPPVLANEAKKMATQKKISCRILGTAELKKLKMGGILAVNQGAVTPPSLIILEYGQRYKKKGTVCLVGKGVTFDTGGISIKPSRDMEKMKYDMSGAAAVIAAMGVVADLKLPVHVVCLAPAVENNVAEDPQRPGDIIRMYNGKTVEVLNTDAEGRLILADALAYCEKYKPKAIFDFATLTGMCAYTFGDKAIAVLGNQGKLIERAKKAGDATGERCWELPMWDDYKEQLKGYHSDLLNIGGPFGGTITAAKFLEEFVPEKTAWAHFDIAGTAWCNSPRPDCTKGATGVGVRLITEMLSNW